MNFKIRNIGVPIFFCVVKLYKNEIFSCVFRSSELLSLKNIGKSGKFAVDVVKGIVEKIPDAIPSTEELLQSGKNLIVGYSFDKIAHLIHLTI